MWVFDTLIFVRTKSRLIVWVELVKQLEELCRCFISVYCSLLESSFQLEQTVNVCMYVWMRVLCKRRLIVCISFLFFIFKLTAFPFVWINPLFILCDKIKFNIHAFCCFLIYTYTYVYVCLYIHVCIVLIILLLYLFFCFVRCDFFYYFLFIIYLVYLLFYALNYLNYICMCIHT